MPKDLKLPLLITGIATPILCVIINTIRRRKGYHHGRHVILNAAEVTRLGINETIRRNYFDEYVYHRFGSSPVLAPREQNS